MNETVTADFYADPLVYHVLHQKGTRAEVGVFERIARRYTSRATLNWLEPASGSGRYLHELARRGHRGTGVDLSESMNLFAQSEANKLGYGKRLTFVTAPMEAFTTEAARFDVALNPINSVRHLMSDRAMLDHLKCVAQSLKPDGIYILGVEVYDNAIAQPTEDVWEGRGSGLRVHQFVSYLPAEPRKRYETVVSHLTITSGRGACRQEQHIDSVYKLRTYSQKQWLKLLKTAGWQIVACYGPTGREKPFAPIGYCLQVLKRC